MSNPIFNGTHDIIDLPGSGSALQAILATGPLYRFTIRESIVKADGSANTPQGLLYTMPGNTKVFSLPAPTTTNEPGDFPELQVPEKGSMSFHGGLGSPLGNGPDTPGAGMPAVVATTLCSMKSATATGTSIEIWQDYS